MSAGAGSAARAAMPMCATGVIVATTAPSLSAPSPTYAGSTISSTSGGFTSCGEPISGFYKEWLRNGAVVSGPTWTTGGSFTYAVGAADVAAGIRSGVQPCNADGCYGSFVLSSNTVTPANRAPAAPTSLAPASGTSSDSTKPTLSGTFRDPDGQSGRLSFTIKRTADNVVVASGSGSTVGSGGTSKWTVPAGKLAMGGHYNWWASSVDASNAGSASVGPTWYGANPLWLHVNCATDGGLDATSGACTSTQDLVEDPPGADTCTGTDGFCDATSDEIAAAGVSTAELDSAAASEQKVTVPEGGSPASTSFTGRWGWLIFNLVRSGNGACGANPVVDNGFCGNLWHSWAQYSNGVPTSSMHSSRFFARSGDNNPGDRWVRNVGPLPDTWDSSATPAGEAYHHWGWYNGHFQGYVRLSDPAYYPGAWSVDPFVVYHSNPGPNESSSRSAFMIHGGWQSHEYESSRSHGCIRLRYQAIPGLRAKWDNSTGNKRIPSGPTLYVDYPAS